MSKVSISIDNIFQNRLISIVEHFLTTDSLLENLNRDEMIRIIVDVLMRNYSLEQLEEMSDAKLSDQIRRILEGQVMFGLLSYLTPTEIADFDAAVRDLRKSY